MKKLANKLAVKLAVLMLATASALIGYSQDNYSVREIQLDNEGNIFTLKPDASWESTTNANLPAVLEKVYGVTNVQLRIIYEERDGKFLFTKFQQQYNNIDIFGGDFIVKREAASGKILLINGCLRKVKATQGMTLSPDSALAIALKDIGNVGFFWEDSARVRDHREQGVPEEALGKPKPEFRYYMENDELGGDFVLAYRLEIATQEPAEYEVYIDAYSGKILGKMNALHPISGSGSTLYIGNQNINIEFKTGLGYILEDSAKKIFTYDYHNTVANPRYFWDSNKIFSDSADKPGVEAHFGMDATYNYFLGKLKRKSYDGKGALIRNNVNFDTNMNNAFWSKKFARMYYGMGNGVRFSPLVTTDIVGHEFSHAVVQHTAGLIYRKESGALNEGFADIFGACVEFRTFTRGANWKIGEDCFTPGTAGDALRDMSNPNVRNHPDCYDGLHWRNQVGCIPTGGKTGNDWCGVHSNSGVLNFWFHILTDGKSGTNDKNNAYAVTGIGLDKSEQIAYLALRRYMNSTTDYKGARIATLQAAEDLHGKKSNEYKQVCNAWYAVNVGEKCCPDSMEFEFKFTEPKCHDSKDGKIELTIKKAKGPFTFEWYKNDTLGPVISTSKNLNGVGKGPYWIWVRDTMAKCEKVEKTELKGPKPVTTSISGGGIHIRACDRKPEIFLQATGGGGTPPYTYNWPNGKKVIATSGSVGNSGFFTGITTDKNGCKGKRTTFAFFIPIRCSYDPNDIIGPPSYGEKKWVSVAATLPYKVRFENDPKFATAPAQKVTIDHPLDTNTDMASFRLGDFGFASWVFEVPKNSSYYSKRLDLRDSLGIYLDVTAGLNSAAKKAFWIFESIDPTTGLPPADANVGFLAVNDTNTHVGEGFVNYTIKPRSTAVTGDSIRAQAEIVFDNNPALLTPKIHNLIDAVAPTSGIRTLPSLLDSVNIPITMHGEDDSAASGFGAWDLYVSENGAAYTLYAQGLTDSTTTYRGNYGNEYRFYTIGLDNVNNREKAKTSADVTVTIAPDQFLRDLDSNISLCALDTLTVKWNYLNIPSFDLQYTADSGTTFNTVKANLDPADSIYHWVVPKSITGKKDYWLRAVASNTGTPIDTSRFFELKDVPDVDLGPDTFFCQGSSFSLVLNPGGGGDSAYLWSTLDTTASYTATDTGTYSLEVTNFFGCKASDEMLIGHYYLPTVASRTMTKVSCNGGSDGGMALLVVGGNAPYSYLWSSGDTTKDITGKPAGQYIVTITDSVSCSINDTSEITEPPALLNTAVVTNVSCFNGSDAEIDLNSSGGTAPYTYLWSNSDTTEKITGLTKGTYTVVTTDANSCVRYDTIVVTEPALLLASHTSENVKCYQGSDGSINLSVTGGTTSYSYLWSTTDTTEDLSGLTAGTYSVIVTDANSCLAYDTVTITEPTQLVSSGTVTNVSCNAGSDGAIDLSVSGGTPGYSYAWSNSATTQDVSGLTAGTYTVVVTDTNSCVVNDTFTVTEPPALAISNTVSHVSCNGGNDGSVDLTVTGGTPGYSFLWSSADTTEDLSAKTAGTYTVLVTDTNSCTIRDTAVITEPTVITSSGTLTHVKCKGGNGGAINLTVAGGTAGYSFLWSNTDTTEDISSLTAGTYSVRITDSKGCIHRDTFIITEPNALAVSKVVKGISCFGLTDGSIDITVTGGVGPYTYLWSNTDTTQDVSALAKGNYNVLVTDANGCTLRDTSTIIEPAKLTISGVITHVSCNGGTNGGVVLTVGGGTTPYAYLWSNTDTTQNLANVSRGTYNVRVTDANSCVIRDTFTITEPTALSISDTFTNVKCNGGSDGTASVTVTGGTTPYRYLWSNSDTTASISGLSQGTYTVRVTDANGCIIRDTIVITEPAALSLTKTVSHISCFGLTDGEISLAVSGGVTPYKYLWSNADTTAKITNLAKGTYTVVVTDSNGCTLNDTSVITEPLRLTASAVVSDVTCFGASDGSVNLTTSGGTAPYKWLWSTSDTTEDVSGLPMLTLSVEITDANGCVYRDTFNVAEPAQLASSGIVTHVNCFGDSTGAIDLSVTGGVTPYSYAWNNSDTTQDLSNIKAGTYTVVITDDNGCTLNDTFAVTQPTLLTGTTSAFDVTCFGFTDGTVVSSMSGGVKPYKYLWNDGDTNALHGNVGKGVYTLLVTDANGCTFRDTVEVKEPPLLVLNKVITQVSCNGGSDGGIDLTITGGTPGYNFLWSNLATSEDLSGLTQGTYSVIVKDANGCELNDTSHVTEPTPMTLKKIVTDLKCKDDASGAIDLTIAGGTPGYTFLWSNLATSEDLTGLAAGTYSVVVTDTNNCQLFDTTVVAEPDSLLGSTVHTDLECYGDSDGTIDLTVTGGTLPYKFAWSNGDTTEDISGLTAGEYSVVVTDSNNCTWYDTVQIAEPAEMVLALDSVPEIENNKDGKAWVTVTGGVGPYTYAWNDPASSTTDTAFNLPRGVYTVVVTDANGCEKTDSINVPSVVGIGTVIQPGSVEIYPNPNQGWVGIYNLNDLGEQIKLVVTDARGRVIVDRHIHKTDKYRLELPSTMVDGTYLLSLYGNEGTVRKQMILIR